jgi:hypothetical protein
MMLSDENTVFQKRRRNREGRNNGRYRFSVGTADLVDCRVLAFSVRNGKVTNVREYVDTLALARAFEVAASISA